MSFPHCDLWGCNREVLWLLQEHSRTLSSQQMWPLSILQPSLSPSPQRSLSWKEVYRGQNPALKATCPLGEWQEPALTTVGMLKGEIPLPKSGGSLDYVLSPLSHPSQSFYVCVRAHTCACMAGDKCV